MTPFEQEWRYLDQMRRFVRLRIARAKDTDVQADLRIIMLIDRRRLTLLGLDDGGGRAVT